MSRRRKRSRSTKPIIRRDLSSSNGSAIALRRNRDLAHGVANPSTAARSQTASSIEAVLKPVRPSKSGAEATRPQGVYHRESQRPLVCLAFVLPLILIYEFATLSWGGQTVRSGLDQWLFTFLNGFGLGQIVLLPLIASGMLIAAHHRLKDHWRVRPMTLFGMAVESLGLGLILYFAANATFLLSESAPAFAQPTRSMTGLWSAETLALIGSGIYEELLFRLILLNLLIGYLKPMWGQTPARAIGIVVISLLFASLHYRFINPAGADFDACSFLFRLGASVLFSLLFLYRGFGIAVGTHVAFDVLTQV